ncbi:MAG TPA: prolipoprotein diacylglyceryl transferase [Candidatus Limnocylindrales bacterium]|nr:prolipoprotein diacylglyceryl transferase [Candidatus Limnocylindrales bacterium]
MIDITPPSIAFQIGPLPIYFYGICYALGLMLAYVVIRHGVRARGLNESWFANGMIIVAIAALIGGRAYHVIDQWQLYKDDLLKIVLPPYAGLGVYGGIFAGAIAVIVYARYHHQSFWAWADVIAPGLFAMEFVARWGNFFNQELYGPPTTAPWGIAIDCAHRVAGYFCPPDGTTPASAHFQPLFLYESISGLLGMLTLLWLSRRFAARLRTGEIALIFFIWYAAVRFMLEFLRIDNWTFFGIPTAQLISVIVIAVSVALLVWRRGRVPPGLSQPVAREPDDDDDDGDDEDDDEEDDEADGEADEDGDLEPVPALDAGAGVAGS